jgi:hypothetical protein
MTLATETIPVPARTINRSCDRCAELATHAHWLPHVVGVVRVELACEKHDPGGYWRELADFESDLRLQHLAHIANKRDGGKAVGLFLRKLYPSW